MTKENKESIISQSIREIVFGAEDGLVSILGLVVGVAGSTTNSLIVLLAGLAGAFPGAVSMAAGTYLGVKAEKEVFEREIQEEKEEIERKPQDKLKEMARFYRSRGLSATTINIILSALSKNKKALLSEMTAHELEIPSLKSENPGLRAVFIFLAYVIGAFFPVFPYAVLERDQALTLSIVITVIAVFVLGIGKGILAKRNILKSGLEALLVGTASALVGFLAGRLVPTT